MNTKSTIAPLLLLCLALFNSAECQDDLPPRVYIGTGVNGISENVSSTNNEIIILGGLFSIYQNPGINPRSIHRMEAVTLAIEQINEDPTILPGVTLGFEIRATAGDVNTALEQSLKYVTARSLTIGNGSSTTLGISGVIGAGFSSVSTSVARLLRLFRIPQISYASTADVLSDKSTFDYFLRTVPSDSNQAQALVDIVEEFDWTYVVAMHTNDVYGTGGITAFVDELERRNSTQRCIATPISISLPRDSTAAEEFKNILQDNLAEDWISNATVIVLFATRNTAIGLLTAVKRMRETNPEFAARKLTWIGSDGWGTNIPNELRDTVPGSLSVAPQSFTNDEFEQHFLSLNPRTHTANPWFGPYWEEVFNCSLGGGRAGYEECDLDAQAFSLESTSLQTSTVTPAMDAVYAFAYAIHNLQRDFCGGGPGLCQAILTDRSGGVAIEGELLLNYLRNVSFSPGFSTEVVAFDDSGDPRGASYTVSNLQLTLDGNYSFETVGEWDGVLETPLTISEELIQWNQGNVSVVPTSLCSLPCNDGEYPQSIAGQAECCLVCRQCQGPREYSDGRRCQTCEQGNMPNERRTGCVPIPVTFLTWTHAWSIVTTILMFAGIIATITVIVIFIIYRKHQIVKASSRELSAVLLTGITLCYLIPIFFVVEPAPWVCGIRRFSIGFCFAICYSALLVKTNRIHRIFNRETTTAQAPHLISPLSQILITALLISVQVVIAVIWLIAEVPSVTFRYSDFSTELICGESTLVELAISLVYSFLLLLATTYYGFRTRNVPQNFNEAKFISFTMYALCILWVAFIPIYFAATARLGVVYQTGSLMLAIILNATITLCCLFVPKIYYLFSTVRKDRTSGITNASQFETISMQQQNLNNLSSSATVLEPRKVSLPNVPAIKVPLLSDANLDKSTQTD
jgi:ABC-type branched-subunit amino acid transport system substrate-binding protein